MAARGPAEKSRNRPPDTQGSLLTEGQAEHLGSTLTPGRKELLRVGWRATEKIEELSDDFRDGTKSKERNTRFHNYEILLNG